MQKALFIFCFLLFTCFWNINPVTAQSCSENPPSDLYVTDATPCGATLHWSPSINATNYKVSYKKAGTDEWSPAVSVGVDTFYAFSGLEQGMKYNLRVKSFCNDGSKSAFTKIKTTLPYCEIPTTISVSFPANNKADIKVGSACPFDTAYCRYGTDPTLLNLLATSLSDIISLSSIAKNKTYFFQISTCPTNFDSWSSIDSFKFSKPAPPNVIMILLDDSRYDFYSCNGAPPFFQTPSIDRIANEGANFKNSFVTHSECGPSRATIATGVYTNKHGVVDNYQTASLNPDLKTFPQILHDQGYTTAFIGKNQRIFEYDKGYFDHWMEVYDIDDTIVKFNYQDQQKIATGYHTELYTDSAVEYISRTDGPYFLWIGYNATHTPLVPAPQYVGVYDTFPMPLGGDTVKYTENYPSIIYDLPEIKSGKEADSMFFLTYEMMASVDDAMERILHTLDSLGELDNTMIIFTSDNGHLLGEHSLNLKRLAYEESIRVPMFIRYPKWFPPSTIVENQITLNTDIAPTILNAAGITDTFNMDGISLNKLYKGSQSRQEMYYHYWFSDVGWKEKLPSIKAVRDMNYKFISYGCDNETEEFFDMVNDPREMTNLINTSAYASLIQSYQNKLAQFETQYGDTAEEEVLSCHLANPVYTKEYLEAATTSEIFLYPNPSDGTFAISGIDEGTVQVFNCMGQMIWEGSVKNVSAPFQNQQLPDGFYYVRIPGSASIPVLELVLMR